MQLKIVVLVVLLGALVSAKLTSDRSRADALKIATAFTRGFVRAVDSKDARRLEKIVDSGFKYKREGCWKSHGKGEFLKKLLELPAGFKYSVDIQRAYFTGNFVKFDVVYNSTVHQVYVNTENGLQLIELKNLDGC